MYVTVLTTEFRYSSFVHYSLSRNDYDIICNDYDQLITSYQYNRLSLSKWLALHCNLYCALRNDDIISYKHI